MRLKTISFTARKWCLTWRRAREHAGEAPALPSQAAGRQSGDCGFPFRREHLSPPGCSSKSGVSMLEGAAHKAPHRLVVRTSRCGRDNPGSTPGAVTSAALWCGHIVPTSTYTWPGSNWRPSACEADVIATRPQVLLASPMCTRLNSRRMICRGTNDRAPHTTQGHM